MFAKCISTRLKDHILLSNDQLIIESILKIKLKSAVPTIQTYLQDPSGIDFFNIFSLGKVLGDQTSTYFMKQKI